jgi:hypothetical protein
MMQAYSSHIGLQDFEIICSGAVSSNSWCSQARTLAYCPQEYVLRLAECMICRPYLCRSRQVNCRSRQPCLGIGISHLDVIGVVQHECRQGFVHVLHAWLSDDAWLVSNTKCDEYHKLSLSDCSINISRSMNVSMLLTYSLLSQSFVLISQCYLPAF